MSVNIPFVRELDFEYGKVSRCSGKIRRVIARNPSAFTFYGTGTYIIGSQEVAVIDPGPIDVNHVEAIRAATEGEEISHLIITHTHMDHSPAAALMKEFTDAKTYGFGPHGSGHDDDGVVVEEGGDMEFEPDEVVRDRDVIEGAGWTLDCVYTPGHTSNHMCYYLREENSLFTGDHVMGWSTSVVSPPDGDMEHYMESLEKLLARDDSTYWPTHGPAITSPKPHVQAFIDHRVERENQIIHQLERGHTRISEMVPEMYSNVDKILHPAAARSVFATIAYLAKRGVVKCEGKVTLDSEFHLTRN